MNAVVEPVRLEMIETPQAPAPRQLTVVEYAVQNGAPVAEVRALVELQIQMDNHKLAMRRQDDERDKELRLEAARNAYSEAMAAFKAEGVRVIRSKAITDGPLKGKKHADLFAVTDAATEVMSKHGLSASWKPVVDEKDWIRLACIVKHVAGHSESVEFGGPIDTGPGRNAIQARKSTVSYLERITLLLALGLAESDADDDDGGGGGAESALQQWIAKAQATTDEKALNEVVRGGVAAFSRDRKSYSQFGAEVAKHREFIKQAQARESGNA
jgi:hypothetical protein